MVEAVADDVRPRCRLYLITPASLLCDTGSLSKFSADLESALDAGDVACLVRVDQWIAADFAFAMTSVVRLFITNGK